VVSVADRRILTASDDALSDGDSSSATRLLPLLVIAGPTAVGKTALSLRLAAAIGAEIISADSRLIYRGLDIGTAKPSAKERSPIPHHLIDIREPDETLTLAQYQRLAYKAIDEVHARGHLPMLVGGTGQHIRAIIEGWGIPEVAPHRPLREVLYRLGESELVRWLRLLDPAAADRIDPHNLRRVIRALEVALISGHPISDLQRKTRPPYHIKRIGLYRERASLYQRIDERVDQMMAAGLLAEVKRLRGAGYDRFLPAMTGLGYKQLWSHLDGELTLAEAVERIKFETHRFARQQATWFRRDDPGIMWFDAAQEDIETVVTHSVNRWLVDCGWRHNS
jgi:tRNA dimethylallyltransferase